MDAIGKFWDSTSAIMVIVIFAAGIALIVTAAYSVLRERRAEDKVVAGIFAFVVLLLVVLGIQEYPAVLQTAGVEGLRKTNANAALFQAEWAALFSSITDPWTGGGGPLPEPPPVVTESDVTIIAPPSTMTPLPTPTMLVLPSGEPDTGSPPTPVMLAPTPTLQPTATPQPTIDLSQWNPQTPAPTPLAGGQP